MSQNKRNEHLASYFDSRVLENARQKGITFTFTLARRGEGRRFANEFLRGLITHKADKHNAKGGQNESN